MIARARRGYGAGKRNNDQEAHRRRRLGLLLAVLVTTAPSRTPAPAKPLLWNLRRDQCRGEA
jgi:hypothetical protein